MKIEELREELFKKLIVKGEFTEDDKEAFNKDFDEPQFKATWDIFLEIVNEAVDAVPEGVFEQEIKKGYKSKKKKK